MGKFIALLYGIVAYVLSFATILYAIGFTTGLVVPKTLDSGPAGAPAGAIIVNLLLMSLFAVQHSSMARRQFKSWWTKIISPAVERSTYVLFASLALILLFWQWRPIPATVWEVRDPTIANALLAFALFGWFLVFISTFLISHFELFGLHQVFSNLAGRSMPKERFKSPLLYKLVRHPIYLGLIIGFWSAPVMTAGHLLFSAVTTIYIFVGIALEERDLVAMFGNDYVVYRQRVGMLIPFVGKSTRSH